MAKAIHQLSATELLAHYRTRTLSPVEVINHTFERIEQLNPTINALYYLDKAGALESARASEQRWLKGEPVGLLDGIPTSVKDALPAKDMPIFRGSAASLPEGVMGDDDCAAVARLKESGAVIYGKNTMCDYGILPAGYSSKHGITRNPWNTDYNTGGSSSGATAAVAAGFETMSIGTDIVGSIRLPASFCGIFGHKPSYGRVPYYFPNNPALVAGPLTRTVADAALMMNVISRPDVRDFTALPYDDCDYLEEIKTLPTRGRLGLITDLGLGTKPDPEVVAAVRKAADVYRAAGFEVVEIEIPFKAGEDACAERYYMARCYNEFSQCPDQHKAEVIQNWTRPNESATADQLFGDWVALQKLRERTAALMQGFDYLLLPSTPVPAYKAELPAASMDELFGPWANNFLFNLTEQPGSSINCGFTQIGLPIGLQIVGPRFDDIGVLRMSALFEALRKSELPGAQTRVPV